VFKIEALPPIKRYWLAKNSNIPVRYLQWDFEDIEKDMGTIPTDLTDWMNDLLSGEIIMKAGNLGKTGLGILFDGSPGRGKTTHAVAILNEFIRALPEDDRASALMHVPPSSYGHKFRPIYYMTYTDFLYRKKAIFDADSDIRASLQDEMDGFHGRCRDDAYNVRLLVLDDLGKEYGSKYDDYSFDDILRTRYDKGLPTIITTNVEMEKWDKMYSEAMGSFAHEAFLRVKLEGEDLRRGQ
jgi:DNA replication protein DnaC